MLDRNFLRIDIFRSALDLEISENLSAYLLSTVSNMLALHYAADAALQKTQKNTHNYAEMLAKKLGRYIKPEVILDENFGSALSLFAAAIAPESPDKPKNIGIVAEIANYACFEDENIAENERQALSKLIEEALEDPNSESIIDLISSRPEVVRALLRKKSKTKDIISDLAGIAASSGKAFSIASDLMQFSGLIACALLVFTANIALAQTMEAIAAAIVVPMSVATLKYGSMIGEIVGEKMAHYDGNIRAIKSQFKQLVVDYPPDNVVKAPEAIKSPTMEVSSINVENLVKDMTTHVSSKEEIENSAKLEKVRQKAKTMALDAF